MTFDVFGESYFASRWGSTPVAVPICPRCGRSNEGAARFCGSCGGPLPPSSPSFPGPAVFKTQPMSSMAPALPPVQNPKRSSSRRLIVVVGIAAVVIVVIVALAVIPVSHPFAATLESSFSSPGDQTYTFPSDSHVSGSWRTGNGEPVNFTVLGLILNTAYTGTGSSGSFSFTALGGPCTFQTQSNATELTSVTGTYSASIL